jgi:hypothetical protein
MKYAIAMHEMSISCIFFVSEHNGRYPIDITELKAWILESGFLPDHASLWSDFNYVSGLTQNDPKSCILAFVTTTGLGKQPALKISGAINSLRRISKQCGVGINQLSNKPWLSASKD